MPARAAEEERAVMLGRVGRVERRCVDVWQSGNDVGQ